MVICWWSEIALALSFSTPIYDDNAKTYLNTALGLDVFVGQIGGVGIEPPILAYKSKIDLYTILGLHCTRYKILYNQINQPKQV